MKHFRLLLLLGFFGFLSSLMAQNSEITAINSLLDRIGGPGTAARFAVAVDPSVTTNGKETFVITADGDKPYIKGNTVSAVTTGINWYLNHYAKVNLTWNQLSTDLTTVSLPTPAMEEKHEASVDYRYYLNYCTFSYSMSTWTWDRWQQEIDWMALHGINMPLQIVGLDVVWQKLLVQDLGYTEKEANDFIAGPCFQAWWGMNNLEGWGGPNPKWWYERQEGLAKKILARQRELGMQPVLPGYSGMVPSNITAKKGYKANNQGKWCNFLRPYILDPNSQAFTDISQLYYKRLEEVMGTSTYYSMDPFHEGANTEGIDVRSAYGKIAKAMTDANKEGKWVIQYWQWKGPQYNVLDMVEKGKLIVLDLFSDAHTHFGDYKGHDAVYCALPNFGGRTGLFGRLSKIMSHFYEQKAKFKNIKGIGATPEAIEQVPVLYDALFELPWRATAPDAKKWVENYTVSRYGVDNAQAKTAWEKARNTALNCETGLQGPHEAVLCARPALQVNSVSAWGGAGIFYDAQEFADAAYLLLQAKNDLKGNNYSYDLTDFTRQALTDYGNFLLKGIKQAHDSGDRKTYAKRRDTYLQLILDIDELLNTNKNFMLGNWTQMARGIADEVSGTTVQDKNWLELNNARTLITTWGAKDQSEWGGLRDYSYREWGGMMKDFYYQRWKTFFANLDANRAQPDWFQNDWNWAHNAKLSYNTNVKGNTAEVAERLFNKYFLNFRISDTKVYHAYRCMESNLGNDVQLGALRGGSFTFPVEGLVAADKAKVGVDFNNDNAIASEEMVDGLTINIPADAVAGNVLAQLTLADGTLFIFKLTLKDEIKEPRTITVKSADAQQGKVMIVGSDALSITNKEPVTIKAVPVSGYNFANWTDAKGHVVSTENPYTYLGAAAADFTANFIKNKWGVPEEDKGEWEVIQSYGQYLAYLGVAQNGASERSIYSAATCPEQLCQTTQLFNAPKGSQIAIHWKDKGGMNYCRLSAYIDLNADGDFTDEGEFITVLGNKENAGNSMLNEHTLKVLLPYDIPEGITHIRLRFDGAWQIGNLNAFDAVPAKAKTLRMVYDLPVNITDKAATVCTVTVKSENKAMGTVDANGQPDTYTYKVGEEVVLRCYPVEGYFLKNWTDKYGREVPKEWMQGNFLRFHAPESNTYTAHFSNVKPGTMTIGDWEMEVEGGNEGVWLRKITASGKGTLDLTASKNPVRGISPELFRGQTSLEKLVVPATLLEMDNLLYRTAVQGNGEKGSSNIEGGISGNGAWTLLVDVENDGSSFNQWGSALLATGGEPFANTYDGGFQFYLKSGKDLIVKIGGTENIFKQVAGNFSLRLDYDGKEDFKVTLQRSNKKTETMQLKHHLNDIRTLSYGIPAGIQLKSVVFYGMGFTGKPFEGCTALTDIEVVEGHPFFADQDGVLFDKHLNQLLCYPEGRLYTKVFALKNISTQQYMTVTPTADKDGNLIATNENGKERQVQTTDALTPASLWKMALVNGKMLLYHYNSKGYLGGKSDSGGEGQILEVLANPAWAGDYQLQWNKNFDKTLRATVTFSLKGQSLSLSSKDQFLKLGKSAANSTLCQWELSEVTSLPLAMEKNRWSTVSLPFSTVVPAKDVAEIYSVTGVENGRVKKTALVPGTAIMANEGVLVKPNAVQLTFAVHYGEATPCKGNLLVGAQARRSGLPSFYVLGEQTDQQVFLLTPGKEVAENCAYFPAENAGVQQQVIYIDTPTGIGSAVEETEAPVVYDLQGRRIYQMNTVGIYIVNGKKQFVK